MAKDAQQAFSITGAVAAFMLLNFLILAYAKYALVSWVFAIMAVRIYLLGGAAVGLVASEVVLAKSQHKKVLMPTVLLANVLVYGFYLFWFYSLSGSWF